MAEQLADGLFTGGKIQRESAVLQLALHIATMNAEHWPEAVRHLDEDLASLDKVIEKCEHEVRPLHDAIKG